MNKKKMFAALLAMCCLLSGCSNAAVGGQESAPVTGDETVEYIDQVVLEEVDLEMELVPLSSGTPAATSLILMPEASGKAVKTGGGAEIDYSNIADGYVMVRFANANDKALRVQVVGPATKYTYILPTGSWVTFPLADGNGSYKVTAYQQNPATGKYATLASVSFQATLTDEFGPFLRPNQYVNYEGAEDTINKAIELCKDVTDPLKKVESIYSFVVTNLTYDKQRAATVQSGYLPVLDSVLAEKKGICFDYAALMTGMLRSQGVPCKLVTGYVPSGNSTAFHAWVSVWTEETGWVEGVIYFDGTSWQRMDPTFASSGKQSAKIMEFIGDGSKYTVDKIY